MRILFIADVFGGPGRKVVGALLPDLLDEKQVDFCILNAENAAGGFGLTPELAEEFYEFGIDLITTGNHIWDRKEIYPFLENRRDILRPLNYPPSNPGRGAGLYHLDDGRTVGVINLEGRVFMRDLDCPFRTALPAIDKLKEETSIVIVDFHAEATAEKVALGWYLDGKVSAVIGTHTHIQTADERVLPGGTGYITDAGMSGSIDGVIGVKKELAIKRFLTQTPNRFQPADSNLVMMGVLLTVDETAGDTDEIERFQIPIGE
ncbi:MAG: TIGR00282 family metallophosphoesterase [Candidatus Glassbacteria bacterium]|nr:TIGR00282 family metallophosphoesterase [Candidatus Glassbacteria bacterium]